MNEKNKQVALILGGTGSIGFACAELLSKRNYDLVIVHRNRKGNMPNVEKQFNLLKDNGAELLSVNINANEEDAIASVIDTMEKHGIVRIDAMIHAIADANIGEIFNNSKELSYNSFIHSFGSMSVSFAIWAQELVKHEMLINGGRIVGFTSEGSNMVLENYAAVGIAKASLESLCKYMGLELAKNMITVNLINSGVIVSDALKVLPNSEKIIAKAVDRNPNGRLTQPEDVAKVVGFLVSEDAAWITGEVIRVDGGEQLKSISFSDT